MYLEIFMKLTKILLSAALLIGTAHFNDAQAIPSLSDASDKVIEKVQQAKNTTSNAAHQATQTISHSSFGQAFSGFGHAAVKKAKSAASGFGDLIAEKTQQAKNATSKMKDHFTRKDK